MVTGSNDALDILSDAARTLHGPETNLSSHIHQTKSTPGGISTANPVVQPGGYNGLGFTITRLSRPDEITLDFWDKCRFVRQGWFTAQEAVTYIDL